MPDKKQPNTPDGWHSRGYLPHFDAGEIPQFITFRLADSMPQALLDSGVKNLAESKISTWMLLFESESNYILIEVTGNVC
jgi:hypothetical protein